MKTRPLHLFVILLLIAATIVSIVYWIAKVRNTAAPGSRSTQVSLSAAVTGASSATIALFGEQPEMLPSAGDLRVSGVVIALDPVDSIAILIESGRARAFRVGAEIAPGVHLAEVHRRYVTVSDGKRSTRVQIPERGTQSESVIESESSASPPAVEVSGGGMRGEPPHRSGNPEEAPATPGASDAGESPSQ